MVSTCKCLAVYFMDVKTEIKESILKNNKALSTQFANSGIIARTNPSIVPTKPFTNTSSQKRFASSRKSGFISNGFIALNLYFEPAALCQV